MWCSVPPAVMPWISTLPTIWASWRLRTPVVFFHIVSKDAGFDPLIRHLKTQGILCARSPSIDELPCLVKSETGPKTANGVATELPPALPKQLTTTLADLIRIAADDLTKRKASRPRKEKTLRSILQASCGKQLPTSQIEKVFQDLVSGGLDWP